MGTAESRATGRPLPAPAAEEDAVTYDNDNEEDGLGTVHAVALALPSAGLLWLLAWWLA